ncbi:MAG: TonB-dependent receptor [Flavobacteriales bacterium]
MKRHYTAALAALCTYASVAQDGVLQGKVTDALTGEALIGVNVIYAAGKGSATDVDGNYRLTLSAGEQRITFSFLGYASHTEALSIAAGEQRTLDMKLTVAAAQLDMVVVTAGKFEQRVGEVTQSLSVLRPDLVRNKNVVSMDQALDQVPGVVVVDEEPQIRAGSGFSYGAGSRVQVMVDDIPILSGDIGRPNWTFLPIENLEQVEVIKGASSVLYGSAALSGVINVRTAYPRSTPSTRVTTFAGIWDTPGHKPAKWWDANSPMFGGANFFHAQQFGKLDLVLGGNAFSDIGYVGPEPIAADTIAADPLRLGPGGYDHRVRFNTGLRWRNGKVNGLSYGVNANAMKSHSSSVLVWDDTDAGLFRPEPNTVTRTLGTQYYVDPFINYYSAAGTRHTLRTRYHHQTFDNDNNQSNSNNTLHAEYQIQQKVDLFGETVITAGVLARDVESNSLLYAGDVDGDGVNSALNYAGYLQVDKKLFDKLALSAGVRYEEFIVNDVETSQPVLRAGATYQVLKATYVRASYGQGFRVPTIGERFISTSVGALKIYPNPDLLAEESWNVEGGVKQGFKLGNFVGYVDAVFFQQDFQNYVEFTFGQWGNPLDFQNLLGFGFKSVNTGGARVTGYEFELTGKGSIGQVQLGALMGYTHTTPISTTPDQVYATPTYATSHQPPSTYRNTSYDPTDDILKFRIRDLFRADLQFNYKRLMWGFSVRYNSDVQNIDKAFVDLDAGSPPPDILVTGLTGWMESHTTGNTIVDARIGFDLTKEARVAFIVNNLSNEVYSLRPLSIEAPRSMQVQLSVAL